MKGTRQVLRYYPHMLTCARLGCTLTLYHALSFLGGVFVLTTPCRHRQAVELAKEDSAVTKLLEEAGITTGECETEPTCTWHLAA